MKVFRFHNGYNNQTALDTDESKTVKVKKLNLKSENQMFMVQESLDIDSNCQPPPKGKIVAFSGQK